VKVVANEAYRKFADAAEAEGLGVRIKSVRNEVLTPGGRARVRLFGKVGSGRPHPRLHIEFPPAEDPDPPGVLFEPVDAPASVDALAEIVRTQLSANEVVLTVGDLDPEIAPAGSEKYWRNSIRAQRLATFFEQARARSRPRSSPAASSTTTPTPGPTTAINTTRRSFTTSSRSSRPCPKKERRRWRSCGRQRANLFVGSDGSSPTTSTTSCATSTPTR
jgi:hypothetical protein